MEELVKFNKIFVIFLIFISIFNLYSIDKLDDLSFVDTEITHVLKTISEAFGVTIVPDMDVQGRITRYFKNMTLEQILSTLLEPLGYMYEVKNEVYFVKKKPLYEVNYNEEKKLFNIRSDRAKIQDIINEMELKSRQTIHFNGDSNDTISINIFDKNLDDTLKLLVREKEDDYELLKEDKNYIVKKKEDYFNEKGGSPRFLLKGNDDSIEIKLNNQSSNDVLISLFKKYDKKLSLLSNKSVKIPYLYLKDVKFDDLLNALFEHSDQTFTKLNDTYYVYDSFKSSTNNRYRVSGSYKLKNLTFKTFNLNIPSQIVPQTSFKLDAENNIVTVFGSPEEVDLYLSYIRKIDLSKNDYDYRIFTLKNIDAKKIKNYLPDKYNKMEIMIFEDQNMFSIYTDNYDYKKLKEFIENIDISTTTNYVYKFRYLNPEDVLKGMLPQWVKKDQVIMNKNDSSLIFNVSEDNKKTIFEYLDTIDIASPVIRYQLLIVEYIHKTTFKLDWGFGLKKGNIDEMEWEIGVFNNEGKTISANFDIPTVFGHYFSVFLENQLLEEKAKIQMSTEIYGLSGESVTLTNTQTLQYRDTIKDTDSNTETPVYNSTTFGLNLQIKGRATTSEEVFIEVDASISDQIRKQGDGAAPDTSEKSVKNTVRTLSGRPIVLGGLTSQKEDSIHNKIPLLAEIIFFGNLFKTHNNSYNDSEFVIYIIPFIQKTEEDLRREREEYIKKMYNYFVKS